MKHTTLLLALLLCTGTWMAAAQPAGQANPGPGSTAGGEGQYQGELFTSLAGGIAFRAPADAKRVKPSAVGKHIVQYANPDEKWSLLVSRLIFEKPIPIVAVDDPATPAVDESLSHPGLLEQQSQQLRRQHAGAQVLREDPVNIGIHDAAILIVRFTEAGQTWLRQQALIEKNDQVYYLFDLRTPSGWSVNDPDDEEDPQEQVAVSVFRDMLDTVRLLDTRAIDEDFEQRLFRTRTFLLSIGRRMGEVMKSEQYFRIQREGKDVGWQFVVEEPGERFAQKGTYVAILTQTKGKTGTTDSVASEMFVTDDRRREAWVTVAVTEKDKFRDYATEIGATERKNAPIFQQQPPGAENAPAPVGIREKYTLNVTQASKSGSATPFTKELPPYYLPQAVAQMLPRLVPLNQAKGYVFAAWITGERELVHRFIDVEPEKSAFFAGKQQNLIRVRDRVGLEGDPTFHCFTPEGKYLGYETPAEKITVLASDLKEISTLWPDAKIGRPHVLDDPQSQTGK